MNIKNIVNFIFELNQLKQIKHGGFNLAGLKNPDTVAEHVMRAAQIGYILAEMEGVKNPEKVALIVLFHDNGEARIGDQNKVSARYFDTKQGEYNAFSDQLKNLDKKMADKLSDYFNEYEERTTREGVIAKDADWLEQAFQAKEYVDLGYESAKVWIDNVEQALETPAAKSLLKEMKNTKFTDWWQGLMKMTYKKLK